MNDPVGVLLACYSEVAVGQLVTVQALVPRGLEGGEEGEQQRRKTAHLDFVGGHSHGGVGVVVVGEGGLRSATCPSFGAR